MFKRMLRCSFFSLPVTASMFEQMQRKLRLNIYAQTIAWINTQLYVALQFFELTAHGRMFAAVMQRKLRLNIYPQPIAWIDIQTHVAW